MNDLTPAEQAELAKLEQIHGKEVPSDLTPEEEAELSKLEQQHGGNMAAKGEAVANKVAAGLSPKYAAMIKGVQQQVGTPEGVDQLAAAGLGGPGMGTIKKIGTALKEGATVAKRSIPGLGESFPAYRDKLAKLLGSNYVNVGDEALTAEQALEKAFSPDKLSSSMAKEGMKSVSPEVRDLMAQKAIEMSGRNVTQKVLGPSAILSGAMGSPHALGLAVAGPASAGIREAVRQLGKEAPVGRRLPIAGLFGKKNKE